MYRQTKRYAEQRKKLANMRAAKDRKRMEGESPDYPMELPELRRKIVIIDYDFGEKKVHVMDLYKTTRVDLYDAYADGKLWRSRIGWSRVLEWVRKAFPRVLSPRAL